MMLTRTYMKSTLHRCPLLTEYKALRLKENSSLNLNMTLLYILTLCG